jgi:SNF2 family DNA or RNA helicase
VYIAARPIESERVGQVPGSGFDHRLGMWHAPLSWTTCVVLRGVFGPQLEVGPALTSWAEAEYRDRIYPALMLRLEQDADGEPDLFPFQRVGVRFLKLTGQALLADEMGTGKTVQAAVAAKELGSAALPMIIVCPSTMKRTWERELAIWWPELRTAIAPAGTAAARKAVKRIADGDADALIINWEALKNLSKLAKFGSIKLETCSNCDPLSTRKPSSCQVEPKELNLIEWKLVIADEVHRGKSARTQQTRALWSIGDTTEYRFALTGSPVANSPEDLWTIMRFVSPLEWPAKTKFIDRFALSNWNLFGGMVITGINPDRRDELFKILDPRFIRRPKAAVMPELPPKVYSTRWVTMNAKQKKAYNELRKRLIVELDSGILMATNPMVKAGRLRQFAAAAGDIEMLPCTSCTIAERIAADQPIDDVSCPKCSGTGEVMKFKLTEPSCKLDGLDQVLDELGGQPCVVFSESRQLLDLEAARLTKRDVPFGQIVGGMSELARDADVEAFQAGNLPVILATLGAGSEGLNLTRAGIAVMLQRSFSVIKTTQSEARLDRYGQLAEKVEIIDIVTEGTIEEHTFEVLRDKGDLLEEIVRDEETIRRWLS